MSDIFGAGPPPIMGQPPLPLAPSVDMVGPTMGDAVDSGLAPKKHVEREAPTPTQERTALVNRWQDRVKNGKEHWEPDFKRMREDQDFALGKQWRKGGKLVVDDRYVVNIALGHIQHKVAALYARNPTVVVKRKDRMIATVWDGDMSSARDAVQSVSMAMQYGMPPDPMAMQIVQDVQMVMEHTKLVERIGQTLKLVYDFYVNNQEYDFKQMMKAMVVRQAVATGVGYAKLGFQRVMKLRPEIEAKIADFADQLATIERLAADIADEETDPQDAEAEQLRLAMAALQQTEQVIVREGLVFSYPDCTAIIPDPNTKQLRGFVGADWVAEEFVLRPERVQEIYGVDVSTSYRTYRYQSGVLNSTGTERLSRNIDDRQSDGDFAVVWEVYNREDRMVYVLCDGWPDFLVEPGPPDVYSERFWPWFPYVPNELTHHERVFPPSDVRLLMPAAQEVNRCRQGLREHRISNRPKTAVAAGLLDQEDKDKLQNHPANAVLELKALQPQQRIEDVLQPIKMPGVDPNLYDVSPSFQDIQRSVGVQEANFGGTSDSTATESSIAESSRMSAVSSNIDDLNEMLTDMARTAGQIMLGELSAETVKKIAGPGATWPELTNEEIADELQLEIEAGSTGRPNKAQEIQQAKEMLPILLQVPGIDPSFIAKEMLRRLDDGFDLAAATKAGLPSITAMNAAAAKGPPGAPPAGGSGGVQATGPGAGEGGGATPKAVQQGAAGTQNAPAPYDTSSGAAPPPAKLHDFTRGNAV